MALLEMMLVLLVLLLAFWGRVSLLSLLHIRSSSHLPVRTCSTNFQRNQQEPKHLCSTAIMSCVVWCLNFEFGDASSGKNARFCFYQNQDSEKNLTLLYSFKDFLY